MSEAESSCDLIGAVWDGISKNSPYQWAAILFVSVVLLTFVTSTLSKNYSQVDKLWSILPALYAWLPVYKAPGNARTLLMACLTTVWSIRLTYNFVRRGGYQWPPWRGDEDYRWEVVRSGGFMMILTNPLVWVLFNFGFISFYQNIILLWIAAPSFVVYTMATDCSSEYSSDLGVADIFLAFLFLSFVLIEAIADNQQYVFQTEKYRRKNAGETLTGEYADGFKQSGLFSVLRKPNYAAEQATWITFFGFSLVACKEWNWSGWGMVQLLLLFQQSGWFTEYITRQKYPKYVDYMKRVPLYVPNPLRSIKSKES